MNKPEVSGIYQSAYSMRLDGSTSIVTGRFSLQPDNADKTLVGFGEPDSDGDSMCLVLRSAKSDSQEVTQPDLKGEWQEIAQNGQVRHHGSAQFIISEGGNLFGAWSMEIAPGEDPESATGVWVLQAVADSLCRPCLL